MKKKCVSLFACLVIIASVLYGCSITQKFNAAMILLQTKMGVKELAMDSLRFNQDVVDIIQKSKQKLFPSKSLISLSQNIIENKLETEIGKIYLGASLNLDNKSGKTLWLKDFKSEIILGDIRLPVHLDKAYKLAPGENEVQLTTEFPIDMRLFSLLEIEQYGFAGALYVALKENGETFSFEFSVNRKISPEQRQAIINKARDQMLKFLASGAGSLLPRN